MHSNMFVYSHFSHHIKKYQIIIDDFLKLNEHETNSIISDKHEKKEIIYIWFLFKWITSFILLGYCDFFIEVNEYRLPNYAHWNMFVHRYFSHSINESQIVVDIFLKLNEHKMSLIRWNKHEK